MISGNLAEVSNQRGAIVRNLTVAAFVALAITGQVTAQEGADIARQPTHIGAQSLGPALKQFAQDRKLQVLYFSDTVRDLHTDGVSGDLSADEALSRLLNGTGLSYRYVDPKVIAIVSPVSEPRATGTVRDVGGEQRKAETSPQSFRLAQADTRATGSNGPPVSAGDSQRPEVPPTLEEIIVTAEKRKERLQDAPVAVTALSGQTLADAHVFDTNSLSNLTPSLTYTQGNHVLNNSFRIRGVGTQVFGAGIEPDVSVVIDGVVLARAAQGFSDLADVERVEVLRGPQGTLFGKNAIAGLINVTTKAPSKEFEGSAEATVAELGEYRFRGTLSGPVVDSLRFRLTGYYDDVEGNIHNVPHDRRTNGSDSLGLRAKLLWEATDSLSFTLSGDYRNMHGYCCVSTVLQAQNPLYRQLLAAEGITPGFNNRSDGENTLTQQDTGQTTIALTGELNLDYGTLTSISAYQAFDFNNNQPIDSLNTPTPLYLPVTNGSFDINGGPFWVGQFTQELRFTSPGGGRFNYVAGLYYLDLNVNRDFIRRTGGCAPGGAPLAYGLPCNVALYRSQGGFHSNNHDKNVAAFGQGDLKLIGGLSALGGVRVQHERVSFWGVRPANTPLVPGDLPLVGVTASSGSGSSGDTAATGKVGLKYEFSRDAQAYLTWSTGYKGAGYNTEFGSTFENEQPVKPETAKTWELGYKTELWDGRLRFNTAVFYADYKDLQVQANRGNADLGIVLFAPTNAGSASTKGVEWEFQARPVSSLTFSGGVTYLETSVDINGLQCPLSAQASAPVMTSGAPWNTCYKPSATASSIQNIHGGVLPQASKWRGDLLARFDHDIPGLPLGGFIQGQVTSQTKYNFTIEQDPLTVQNTYTIANASVGVHDRDSKYQLSLFVNNVFNQHYVTLIGRAATLTSATVFPNSLVGTVPKDADRYFGATVSVLF
ncbi:MAG: tonB dependent receptor family protein [Gammaproteobacteria bacterium]|nr:tonB dependent receptor family protein [Gammaproteobacteria bacterium]